MPKVLILILIPLFSSLLVLVGTSFIKLSQKYGSMILSIIPLAYLIFNHSEWLGSSVAYEWIPYLSVNLAFKIDEISLLFLYLTAIIIPLSIFAVPSLQIVHSNAFFIIILLLEAFLFAFFTAGDLVVFTIFWEAMLLPLFFIINIWGKEHRQAASMKFLVYMIGGSALMVVAVIALFLSGNSFDLDILASTASHLPHANLLFLVFLLAFAVKTPLFPFHAWLPDAYTQAPTSGTILLAGILSKAGIYGIIRILLEIFPAQLVAWSPLLVGLALVGVIYGGLAAWGQNDFKRLIAYSSFSHINFILLGLFVWNATAHTGAVLQAFNHGITITALFLAAGWLEERLCSTAMGITSGLAKFMPGLCWLTVFFVLSSIALPGLNNFVGELLILFGIFGQHPWLAATAGLTVILSAIYMLHFIQDTYFGEPKFFQKKWVDIRLKEALVALPLIFIILWIGLYPNPVLRPISTKMKEVKLLENRS